MARLRLFANLRESAGTDAVDIEAPTVGALVDEATSRFGSTFEEGLASAGVWVNGEAADAATPLSAADEVALIPPVSGGTAMNTPGLDTVPNVLSVALVVALLAVAWAAEEWFVIVAVGAVMAWVWDLHDTSQRFRDTFVVFPPIVGAAVGGAFAFAWGFNGLAGALAAATVIAASWPVFDQRHREFRTTAATVLVSVLGTLGAGGLVLIRLIGTHAVVGFVIITVFALVGSWVAASYGQAIQSVDANVGALLGALAAGLLTGLVIEELDMAAGLLGAVAVAAGVIAGRALGSMLRTGSVAHTENPPGSLAMFDGAILAAPLFWIAIWVFG